MATPQTQLIQKRLSSGLRLITTPLPGARSATVAVFVGAGSRYETPEINGISHFIEHLMFRGTAKRPTSREIAEAIEGLGGSFNAYTSDDKTCYYAKVPARHVERAFDVISDMLEHSRFEPAMIDRERGSVIEEINLYQDDPAKQIDQISSELIWPGQPLGMSILGTKEVIGSITRDQVLSYVGEHYRTGNMVVSVSGAVDEAQVEKLAERYFGGLEQGSGVEPEPAKEVPGVRVATVKRPTDQTQLLLASYAPSLREEDRYTVRLLNAVLGGGMSSRLFQRVRDELGLAYFVRSFYEGLIDGGSLVVRAGVTNERSVEAVEVIAEELQRLRREPVSESEFTKARELLKGSTELRLEDSESLADWLGGQAIVRGEAEEPESVLRAYDAATPEAVGELAERMFGSGDFQIGFIGPDPDEARLKKIFT